MSNRNSVISWSLALSCVGWAAWSLPAQADAPFKKREEPSALELVLTETHTQCELLGLGAIGTVPHNFPGADAVSTARYRLSINPGIVETSLAAGGNAYAPAILGGDLGAPFMHGDGQLYFTFGDAWFESPARSSVCAPNDAGCTTTVMNDDLIGFADPSTLTAASECIGLEMPRVNADARAGDVMPITWDGPGNRGGHALGSTVPGPGFSTGPFMFLVTSGTSPTCGATQQACAAANGLATDVCKPDPQGVQRCYFGVCGDEPDSPCGLRLNPASLLVRTKDSDFTAPQVGVHIASERVLAAYRAHFATVSVFSDVLFESGAGRVWVLGRDTFWGAPGLTMSPYLMYHPVHDGQLEEPLFFAGMQGDEPVFSAEPDAAVPVYDEHQILNAHTSLVFEPELDGGTWLMLYGGHAQPVLRNLIGAFVQPVVDDLFYDREAGVYLRWAKQPWGPWSEPVTVFNPYQAGQGGYCENMYFEDVAGKVAFQCPQPSAAHNEALNRGPGLGMAGEYGAALVPGSAHVKDGHVTLRWLLSTWNPYRVILQESQFCLQ